mgnify:FL=1
MSKYQENWTRMNNFYQKKCEQQSALQIIQKERSETVLVNAAAYFLHPQKGGAKINDQMLKNLFIQRQIML